MLSLTIKEMKEIHNNTKDKQAFIDTMNLLNLNEQTKILLDIYLNRIK